MIEHWSSTFNAWAASLGDTREAFLRLVLAGIAGALVGLEREVRGRNAGFRTNLLLCLGCAMTMLVSLHVAGVQFGKPGLGQVMVDPARIAYGVMTGIGFIGGGAIMKHGANVKGLTTAAAMWCVAGIGLGMGLGLYFIALFAAGFVIAVLWLLEYFERMIPRRLHKQMTLHCKWQPGAIDGVADWFHQRRANVVRISFQRWPNNKDVEIKAELVLTKQSMKELERELEGHAEYELMALSDS